MDFLVIGLALVVGLAIHQGGTCAVLATRELIAERKADRFLAFVECGLWAMLTLWLAARAITVSGWEPVAWFSAGAVLFGLGAAINGACAFGTIAWLGSGRLDFLLTGVAAWACFFLVDILVSPLIPPASPFVLSAAAWTPLLVLAGMPVLVGLRLWLSPPRAGRRGLVLSAVMALIGVAGSVLAVLHQPWPWLAILRNNFTGDRLTLAVLAALLTGAVAGGLLSGRFRLQRPSAGDLARRAQGGALMGLGAVLVPGGNDALIFYGLPSASPMALWGYLLMLASIGAWLVLVQKLRPFWRRAP